MHEEFIKLFYKRTGRLFKNSPTMAECCPPGSLPALVVHDSAPVKGDVRTTAKGTQVCWNPCSQA